jgi:hypothetical protein
MNKHLTQVCKIGQAEKCCRYLISGHTNFECAKLNSIRSQIDAGVLRGHFIAQGDNCEGLPGEIKDTIELENKTNP